MRILGVDPGLRSCGWGVVETPHGVPGAQGARVVAWGEIRPPQRAALGERLAALHTGLAQVAAEHSPDEAALESVIYAQNVRTALLMGAARGAALIATAEAGLPTREYAPRRVKQAVSGRGAARKDQVGFMVRALLGLQETPPPDAADALAVALTRLQDGG